MGATILLVEDRFDLREVLRIALIGGGYNVLAAEDGRVALGILRSHSGVIDLVLSDLILPFSSGWELAKESSHLRPTTWFLMMSGYPGSALRAVRSPVEVPIHPKTVPVA